MIRATICLLAVMTALNGSVDRLSPLSDFWKENARKKYSEMFKEETTVALLCAPSFPSEIKHGTGLGVFNGYLIYVTQNDGDHIIHLRDIYKDAEKNFSFVISEKDVGRLKAFFAGALKTLEAFDRLEGDGTSYIVRVQGADNEFAYTWSPQSFTYANDITIVMGMIRDDCIRSIGRDFSLSQETKDFMRIVELTPNSMREEYSERDESIEPVGSAPVDPFKEQTEKEKAEKVNASYRAAQLYLLFKNERKQLLTSQ